MGIEVPGQPPFFQSPRVTIHPESLSEGAKASHCARKVQRLSAANDQTELGNSSPVEKRASNGGAAHDATVHRDFVAVDTPRVELFSTLASADEAFLADLEKCFAASGEEGIVAQKEKCTRCIMPLPMD